MYFYSIIILFINFASNESKTTIHTPFVDVLLFFNDFFFKHFLIKI